MPYQDAPSPPMTAELARQCARAVHVITPDGRTLRAGRASLHVMGLVGWRRFASVFSAPPLVWLVEVGYWIVARNRPFFARFMFRR